MTVLEVAHSFFPEFSQDELEAVIWGLTGFPEFWRIPEDGNTPGECFRRQLNHAAVQYRHTGKLPWPL